MGSTGVLLALALGGFTAACRDVQESPSPPAAQPEPPLDDSPDGSTLGPIDLVYVCDNKFLVTNSHKNPVQVIYHVLGTRETGSLLLRQGPDEDPAFSETELNTTARGPVEILQNDQPVVRRANLGMPCGAPAVTASLATTGDAASAGKWDTVKAWGSPGIVAVHLALLPSGKVLSWGKYGDPQVWDPATGKFTPKPSPSLEFCAGLALLPDGRLMAAGGHISDDHGLPDVNFFDYATEAWSPGAPMAKGRWYPTVTVMGDGKALVIAGRDQNGKADTIPDLWNGIQWLQLNGAHKNLPYYPRMFLAPNGKLFYAGEKQKTRWLSTSGSGSWSSVGDRKYGTRDYGSAVMYAPGKILYAGGGLTTNTAEIIDLNQAAPVWQWTGSMAFARRHLNAVVLPTGDVLVTGGTAGTTFTDETKAVHAAELWSPTTGTWTQLASAVKTRAYHGTAILLPDARVLQTGSGDGAGATAQRNYEIFSPPYLFQGARPVITSAPASVGYGQAFFVGKTDTVTVAKVSWIRLGATTHAFDENQRFVPLSFTTAAGGLTVTAPALRNISPPGHYLLFLVSANGVPSVARIAQIK
jgi:hypothetical protein